MMIMTWKEYYKLNESAHDERWKIGPLLIPSCKEVTKLVRFWEETNHDMIKNRYELREVIKNMLKKYHLTKKELFSLMFEYPALVKFYKEISKELEVAEEKEMIMTKEETGILDEQVRIDRGKITNNNPFIPEAYKLLGFWDNTCTDDFYRKDVRSVSPYANKTNRSIKLTDEELFSLQFEYPGLVKYYKLMYKLLFGERNEL